MSSNRAAYQLSYQVSPIILTGGIAQNMPGNALPIIALTQGESFTDGLLAGAIGIPLEDYFAQFIPIPGSTLQNWQIGEYPFANQTVAANAVIAQPNTVSLEMICPCRLNGDYASKLATITALKTGLDTHILSGGTFTVATPGYIYTNAILRMLRDITGGDEKQKQIRYQWDFEQPLVALLGAQNAYNSLMSKLANGLPFTGQPAWSGPQSTIGNNVSGALGNSVPSGSSAVGALSGGNTMAQGYQLQPGPPL